MKILCVLSGSYLMSTDSRLTCLGLVSRLALPGFTQNQPRMIRQISPDKNMNFHSTTAPFTVSTELRALLSMANLPIDSAFYDVSVRRLTALLQASFPQSLTALQLPFANSCCTLKYKYRSSPIRDLHPISFMPMPGVPFFCSRLRGCCVNSEF